MCLGVPAKLVAIKENEVGVVDIQGNQVQVSIALTPEANVGDHVMVHAGFAMEIIDEEYALETMALLQQLKEYRETVDNEAK